MRIGQAAWMLAIAAFFWLEVGAVEAAPKTTIGLVEDVLLLPWKVRLPARIDTGAATSSLDARSLTVKDNMAEFRLPEKYGGMAIRLPVVGWRTVRSAEARDRRPVVELDLCVGPKHLRVNVNLNDRSAVRYPLILGRNVLRKGFVVDCMRSNCAPPVCAEIPPR